MCGCVDNEEHRLNSCVNYAEINYSRNTEKISFDTIFSSNIDTLRLIILRSSIVWNVTTGNGSILRP